MSFLQDSPESSNELRPGVTLSRILLRRQSLLTYTETRGHLMSYYKMEIHQKSYTVGRPLRPGITLSKKARQRQFDDIIMHCTNSQ